MNNNLVDFAAFIEELRVDYDILKELYLSLSVEIAKEKEKIKQCIKNDNWEEAANAVHNMKGMAGNYRAIKVHDISSELYQKLKCGSPKEINYYILALYEVVDETVDMIQDYFKD